ncbi:MAG: helix-turn-helix domain-containing protein [Deltaproteobacteria bacterium]|nr:helix-turn-helix domain-containing protein [Deltaproteobacteria bacterium]
MGAGVDVAGVIRRMKEATGTQTDEELGTYLKKSRQTVGNWRARESVPWPDMFEVARRTGASLDYLALGEGPPLRAAAAAEVEQAYGSLDPALKVIVEELRRTPDLVKALHALRAGRKGMEEALGKLAGLGDYDLELVLKLLERMK